MINKKSNLIDKQLLSALLDLNLTHKEAQAYHALVCGGVMTAEDISRIINVQHPIVYRTLEGLRNKGWIDSTTDRPKKYRAKHPETAARSAENLLVNRASESARLVADLLQGVYNENQEIFRQEIWTVRGLDNVIRTINEMGNRTRHGVFGKITGPIDDNTFNRIFCSIPANIPASVQIMGPPIVGIDKNLKARVRIKRPPLQEKCKQFPMANPTAKSKEEFLKQVHGNRFITLHLLFDEKEALWINIPYRDNTIIEEKVWASWIVDPEYIEIIKAES